jgi:tetratricopeptide (TPR) repeat protein
VLRAANEDAALNRLGVDLLLDGTVRADGKSLDVRYHLDDAHEHVVIWSDQFRGPAAAPAALQTSVAAHAADVAYWARIGRSGKVRLDAATLAAFIAGRESTTGVRNGSAALTSYQRVVAAAPDFSWGHSAIAVTDGFQLLGHSAASPGALRAEAQREARRALALEPHNGEAYLALELSVPLLDWRQREALLLQGAAADPGFEPGALMEGRLLWRVGLGQRALPWLQRAHDIDQLHNGATWSLAVALASEGRSADAKALLAQMQDQWPDHVATRDARFWIEVIGGATPEAVAVLADPAKRPLGMDQMAVEAWREALNAGRKDSAARAAAARTVITAADAGSLNRGHALTLLAMLGDLDGAFAQAQLYDPDDPYSPPYLFLPPTAPMRFDPRFMALARRLGFLDYWRSAGRWPEFCRTPGLPYDCRVQGKRAGAAGL